MAGAQAAMRKAIDLGDEPRYWLWLTCWRRSATLRQTDWPATDSTTRAGSLIHFKIEASTEADAKILPYDLGEALTSTNAEQGVNICLCRLGASPETHLSGPAIGFIVRTVAPVTVSPRSRK
jgi:hypothetical protein